MTPPHDRMPPGFSASAAAAGLKRDGALDIGLLLAETARPAAALYTQNRLLGAHIPVCRDHLKRSGGLVRAVLVNAKNANCATGEAGIRDARKLCASLAERLDCPVEQVLMVSTGVIGAPLQVGRIEAVLDPLLASASPTGLGAFAEAIRTTDLVPKVAQEAAADGSLVCGSAKGSGMIHPDMATMLGFLLAERRPADLRDTLRQVCDRSFHRITVDGDTSPNDTVLLWCGDEPANADLEAPLTNVATTLARAIARDGEGASRLITVEVRGAPDEPTAAHVGRVIATSPLTKTAVAGRDPNWGRILSAAGRAGVPFDPAMARVWVGEHMVYDRGQPLPAVESAASHYLNANAEVVLGVDLAMGTGAADCWTCDFTTDYVQINADYRT